MCDNQNIKADRMRCEACRTINLAKHVIHPKPDMEMYEKCTPAQKVECSKVPDLPLNPTCIRVCSKEEYKLRKAGMKPTPPKVVPLPAHGKLMYAVKAGIVIGTAYFTYSQGVWGDQVESTECWSRWQEYMKSINSRRRPTFDQCGNVIRTEIGGSLIAPIYDIYKEIITSCFSGVVKVPLIIKCAYIDYLNALEKRKDELAKERKIQK